MSTLAQRLQELVKEKPDYRQKALADACFIKPPSVADWFKGKTKNLEGANLQRAADYFGVMPLWLAEGKLPKWKPPTQRISVPSIGASSVSVPSVGVQEPRAQYQDDVVIAQYETGGKMGHGLVLRDQPGVIENWKVSIDWARANIPPCTSFSNLRIVTGYGDSNKGLYNSGDPLIIDTGVNTVDRDAVFFFRVGDEGYIKQLQRIPSAQGLRIKVKSFNERYDPWWIEEGLDFEVFGLVLKVWQGHNL